MTDEPRRHRESGVLQPSGRQHGQSSPGGVSGEQNGLRRVRLEQSTIGVDQVVDGCGQGMLRCQAVVHDEGDGPRRTGDAAGQFAVRDRGTLAEAAPVGVEDRPVGAGGPGGHPLSGNAAQHDRLRGDVIVCGKRRVHQASSEFHDVRRRRRSHSTLAKDPPHLVELRADHQRWMALPTMSHMISVVPP
jgi:hypothetical protein